MNRKPITIKSTGGFTTTLIVLNYPSYAFSQNYMVLLVDGNEQ